MAIARQAIDAAEFAIRSRAHTLSAEMPDHAVPVMADPVRLEQIVANLLGNAIKYTPPGGRITVAVSPAADAVTLRVSDMRASCPARSSSSTATRSRTRPRVPRPYGSRWSGRRRSH